jgi:aspartokinase
LETIAVYFEKRIKTYGFSLFQAQEMLTWQFEGSRMGEWAKALSQMEAAATTFSFAFARRNNTSELTLSCVSEKETADRLMDRSAASGIPVPSRAVVDLLFFHGPHFNERPGIVSETVSTLKQNGIQALTIGCSASSVYLVLREGTGEPAKRCLETAFEVPKDQIGKIRRARNTGTKAGGK